MDLITWTRWLAWISLAFSAAAFAWRLVNFNRLPRPAERAAPKGKTSAGVVYAYTLGMAPWAKESTRNHWVAYLRGVGFHLGVFLSIALLVISPWVPAWPGWLRFTLAAITLVCGLLALAGIGMRLVDPTLKPLSTPDDFLAVLLVGLFQLAAALWLVVPASGPLFFIVSALTAVYAPLSKIRHCIYYAYSRFFYGRFVGVRGVLPHSQQRAR
jgi:hypothetical protein